MDINGAEPLECPDDSILLAYVNKQQFNGMVAVFRHLNIEQCEKCQKKCQEYELFNQQLAVLKETQSEESYPPIVDSVMQKVEQSRNRQSLPSVQFPVHSWKGLSGLPLKYGRFQLIAVLIILTGLLIFGVVWAATHSEFARFPGVSTLYPGGFPNQGQVIPNHSLPTSTPVIQVTGNPTSGVTPGTVLIGTPTIEICTTPEEQADSRIAICVHNYPPGDRVAIVLVQPLRGAHERRPLTVDAQGNIRDSFYINRCKFVPIAIYVADKTHPDIQGPVLRNISYDGCSGTQATPTLYGRPKLTPTGSHEG